MFPVISVKKESPFMSYSNYQNWVDKAAGATSSKVLRQAIGFARHAFINAGLGIVANKCEISLMVLSPMPPASGVEMALALDPGQGNLWYGNHPHVTWDPLSEAVLLADGMGVQINSVWAAPADQAYLDNVPPWIPATTSNANLALYRFYTSLNVNRNVLPGAGVFPLAGGPNEIWVMRFVNEPF